MTEDQIRRIEQQLISQYITEPAKLDDVIATTAQDAARQVMFTGTAKFEFYDGNFIARSREDIKNAKRRIILVISNEASRELAGNSYVPYMVNCELDNNFSVIENYKAIFEAFLRHLCGIQEPEVLED